MTAPTFRQFVAGTWKTACYDRCKPSTRQRMDSALRTQLLPTFGAHRLDRICRDAIHQWFDRYSRVAPAGANRTLDVLRQIFNHAIACGFVATNPTRDVRRNPRPKATRFLSRGEVDRLHKALAAHRGRGSGAQQAEIIRLLLLTGCRKGEIVGLRWSEIHEESLRLTDSKTGPRTVVLNAQARAILARQPRTGSPFVFPSLGDASQCRSNELSLWRKMRREAGLTNVRIHDLRHTFASHAVMQSVPLPVVSRLLGHSQARMTLRYAHVSDRETEAAAERIGCAIAALWSEPAETVRKAAPVQDPPEKAINMIDQLQRQERRPSNGIVANSADGPDGPAVELLTPNAASETLSQNLETVTAQKLCRSLGNVLDRLERGGGAILVCRRQTPAAALVSLKDYHERFLRSEIVADQAAGNRASQHD